MFTWEYMHCESYCMFYVLRLRIIVSNEYTDTLVKSKKNDAKKKKPKK